MGIHMEYNAVYTYAIVMVKQLLQHSGMFIPCATDFCKALSLYDILSVYMRSVDGIKHIVKFVVGRTAEPELPHWVVGKLVVAQSVANHCRCNTFCRQLHAVFVGEFSQFGKEYIIYKISDSESDIPKNLF